MGNHQNKDLRFKSSKFLSEDEIREKRRFWNQMFPTGVATRSNFHKFAEKVAIEYDNMSSVDFMFRAMDADKNGEITFDEFLWYMAITSPTNHNAMVQVDDLVDMCFLMYDEDGDGYVTKEELRRTMNNVFSTQGHDITEPEVKENIEKRIRRLLEACDKDHDGRLTKQEVKVACRNNPSLVDFL